MLQRISRSNSIRDLRNFLNIRPSFSYVPKFYKYSVSDFFFWSNTSKLKTNFFLNNLASQIIPNKQLRDLITIFIYSYDGNLIKSEKIKLDPFQSKIMYFDDLEPNMFGSFCVFHTFNEIENLLKPYESFLSERGYSGFSNDGSHWNFIHGNTACLELHNETPKSLLCRTLKKNIYRPQIIFDDNSKNTLIFNNPSNKNIKVNLVEYNIDRSMTFESSISIKKKGTVLANLRPKTSFVNIFSNFLLHRPLILRNYKKTFDILHG